MERSRDASCHALLSLDLRARRHNDMSARHRECLGRLQAKALVTAGHHDNLRASCSSEAFIRSRGNSKSLTLCTWKEHASHSLTNKRYGVFSVLEQLVNQTPRY